MTHRLTAIVVGIVCSLSAWAQSADSRAADCLSESRWFDLHDVYAADSAQMSPFIRQFARTMVDQMFNRPQQACDDILTLVRGYQQQLGGANACSMLLLLADNYSRMGDNARAAATVRSLADQMEGKADSATVAQMRGKERLYSALSALRVNETDTASHTLPFTYTELGDTAQQLMVVGGSVNGRKAGLIFDTGAAYNVITPEMARRYRLRIIDADIQVSGTRLMGGKMAVADVLTIGSLTVRNVVFAVLDMTAGNERARRVAQQISLVIGQPLLQLFGSYTIDFASQQIHLTHQSHRSGAAPNLFFNKVPYVAVTRDSLRMAMALDTGAATSSLDNAYYKAFAADVAREGKWELAATMGVGGISYNSVFRMPAVALSIGDTPFTLHRVPVTALSPHNRLTQGYGRLGIDFMRQWSSVTIDNVNMTIHLQH